MAQILKQDKFSAILTGAGRVFALVGYRRAMMSDIAEEAGVALGTLYRYADSKEELFELALRKGLGEEPTVLWARRQGGLGFEASLFDFVRNRLVDGDRFPALADALERGPRTDPAREIESIVGELYDEIARQHVLIRMIDRSANGWPELARLYSDHVRQPVLDALEAYLNDRCESGALRAPPNMATAARFIVEICATFAMHRHFTPGGNYASDREARDTALHFVLTGFVV